MRNNWGGDRVWYLDATGRLRTLPVEWTDVRMPDPAVTVGAGRAFWTRSKSARAACVQVHLAVFGIVCSVVKTAAKLPFIVNGRLLDITDRGIGFVLQDSLPIGTTLPIERARCILEAEVKNTRLRE